MIDTHAHLLMLDAESIAKNMKGDSLDSIVTISTTLDDSRANIDLAKRYKNIYCAVGIYPEYSNSITEDDLKKLEDLAREDKVVAIGEIGLDFHGENFDKEAQKRVFLRQIEIANALNLPFCVHSRSAADDVYEILSKNKNLITNNALMHCYSDGEAWIKKFVDLGLYISFSGNFTFKKYEQNVVKSVPLDRLLVETDSPYLAPVPLRGTKNEPKNVKFVIEKIAQILDMPYNEVEKITTENAKKFYGIK